MTEELLFEVMLRLAAAAESSPAPTWTRSPQTSAKLTRQIRPSRITLLSAAGRVPRRP